MKLSKNNRHTRNHHSALSNGATVLFLLAFGVNYHGFAANAMMANPRPFTETQPDGQLIRLRLNGDPYDAWTSDADGYTVVRDPITGFFVYAEEDGNGGLQPSHDLVVPLDDNGSRRLASESKNRKKHLRPSKRDCSQMICGDNERRSKLPLLGRNLRGYRSNDRGLNDTDDDLKTFNIFNITRPQFQDSSDDDNGNGRRLRTTGTLRNLVVLLKWEDHADRPVPSPQDIDVLMNHDGPHPLAPTGSVRTVFLENSYDSLQLESTITDWVVVNNTEHYFANGNGGRSSVIWEAIEYALHYLDDNDLVDFDYFDEDQDGQIDCITFLHSGYGAEFGGTDQYGAFWEDRLWSHKWALYVDPFVSKSGVQVMEYHISPSLWGRSNSKIGRIGVIAHETGHFLGVPDLYDIDGGGIGVGCFDLMANSWGFDGRQYYPPQMSAWTKLLLGWVVPYFPSPGENQIAAFQLRDASLPQVYAITDGFPDGEFLLIENRQRRSYDIAMPQSGLLIYHIDHGLDPLSFRASLRNEGHPWQENWPQNGNHYGVAVLQADGNYDLEQLHNSGDAGDYYHGGGVNHLVPCYSATGDCQYPNTDSYQLGLIAPSYVHITDISETGDVMTFNYRVGGFHSQAPSEAPSAQPTASPTSAPSSSPSEPCLSSGHVCRANDSCCSGYCDVPTRRFFGKCW
jgi:M6 family metalloprotease-like protein